MDFAVRYLRQDPPLKHPVNYACLDRHLKQRHTGFATMEQGDHFNSLGSIHIAKRWTILSEPRHLVYYTTILAFNISIISPISFLSISLPVG